MTSYSEFMDFMQELNIYTALIRVISAVLLGAVIGIERGYHGRAAAMRTHSIVCIGSALTVIVGLYAIQVMDFNSDPLRIAAQVISGIGFLGAGTILLKGHSEITGLTTAAGLWATAAIGLALGIGYYVIAVAATILIILVNTLLPKLEKKLYDYKKTIHIYSEISDVNNVNKFEEIIKSKWDVVNMAVVPAKSGVLNQVGINIEILYTKQCEASDICRELSNSDFVAFSLEM